MRCVIMSDHSCLSKTILCAILVGLGCLRAEGQETGSAVIQVMQGPDSRAIYARLRPAPFQTAPASEEYVHRTPGEVAVQMQGFLTDDSPGNPALPYQRFQVALPPDVQPGSLRLQVLHLVEKELPEKVRVAAAPPNLFDQQPREPRVEVTEVMRWGTGKRIVDGRNMLIYGKDAAYPDTYCGIRYGGQLRKWRIGTIVYHPIRYNPVTSKLYVAEELLVKITGRRDSRRLREKAAGDLLRDDAFDDRAEQLLLNFDRAKDWYTGPLRAGAVPGPITKDDATPAAGYVVVTTNAIFDFPNGTLGDFCFHKAGRGFGVTVVTEDKTHTIVSDPGGFRFETADGGYGPSTPEAVRQWLQDNYVALSTVFVLLVGNPDPDNPDPTAEGKNNLVGDLPMPICWHVPCRDKPTDCYFSDLTGNWDLDGDGYFGEQTSDAGETHNIPANVGNMSFFCAQWEGVLEVVGSPAATNIRWEICTDGQLDVFLDRNSDGDFDDLNELLFQDPGQHWPLQEKVWTFLSDGVYPVLVQYRQSAGDAQCSVQLKAPNNVAATFRHDDGTGNLAPELLSSFYDNNNFSGPPVPDANNARPVNIYHRQGDSGPGGVDFYPEVFVGRIPVYSDDDDGDGTPDYASLNKILAKTMAYESANAREQAWRRNVLISTPYMYNDGTVADYRGGEALMDHVAPPPAWQWYRIHEEAYPDVQPPAEVNGGCDVGETVDGWNDPTDPNDGRGVVMWRTHGWYDSASYVFHANRCVDLDDSKPSIVLQMSCDNGWPEERPGDAFPYPLGYHLLENGAVATISSTRPSAGGTFRPADLDIGKKNNPYLMYYLAEGVFHNNEVGRVLAHVREQDAQDHNYWNQAFNYNLYGDPSVSLLGRDTSENTDIVFLLDGSGSMLLEGKWDAARNAAVLFYELVKALRGGDFQDRYNTVVFRWHRDGARPTPVPAGSTLTSFAQPLTVDVLAEATPDNNYLTPIGDGLITALEQLALTSQESVFSNKTILLLSDGMQNQGTELSDVHIPLGVKVHAVGLGNDSINPGVIEDIADATDGDYIISPSSREIVGFFCQLCMSTWSKLQEVPVTPTDTDGNGTDESGAVFVDQDRAVFLVVWDDPSRTVSFDLDPPGNGANITPTENHFLYLPMGVTYRAPRPGESYAFYVCQQIPAALHGEWRLTNIRDENGSVALGDVLMKVIEDPRTIAEFDIENAQRYTGQPITLTATITEDGRPKTGLTQVYADPVRLPDRSLGTLMARYSPPTIVSRQSALNIDGAEFSDYLRGVMQRLGLDDLARRGTARIELRDDGLAGDLKANDGIYTGTFHATRHEGSYTFEFYAGGENNQGVKFERTETLSKYVEFGASPGTTNVQVLARLSGAEREFVTLHMQVTPRNAFGEYLGPFRSDRISVWSRGGRAGDLQDHQNGSYTFTLTYPKGTIPDVYVAIGDVLCWRRICPVRPCHCCKILRLIRSHRKCRGRR